MKIPREQRPIDVTTLPSSKGGISPPQFQAGTRRSSRRSAGEWVGTSVAFLNGTLLPSVGLWLRRPISLIVLVLVLGGLAVGANLARSRSQMVDGPALSTVGWHASASSGGKPGRHAPNPAMALDGDPKTRWQTRGGQRNSDWFAVDMGKPQKFHQVVMDAGTHVDDYPRSYAVYVSGDGVHWGASVASGDGHGALTVVNFSPQTSRYIKVVQTGQDRHTPWSIAEFTVH